jgi:hypothetical protein
MNLIAKAKSLLVFAALPLTLVLSSAFISSNNGQVRATAAYPLYEKEITYYSDASYTNHVGTGHIYCNGRSTLTGTSTQYYTEDIQNVCCGSLAC